ncbi:MAG: MucB/RseB C-terminal domain-containing protein [Ketobacteraceae bacterium]|nr:MucB/RseB C-terminal domain-containing protein [Ketobacteraceae bacterium]
MLPVIFWMLLLMLFPFGNSFAREPLSVEATPQQWLAQMASAVRELNYRGRSILMNGDQLNSVEIVHAVFDGEPWERVIHLTGEPAEILRRGDRISCLHPDKLASFQASGPVAPHKPFLSPDASDRILRYYQLAKAGGGRVAGREVQRVDVMPRDRNRYGYQFWLDNASGLMLKSVTVDHDGRGLEVFEYVDIDVGINIPREAFEPGKGLHWVPKPERKPEAAADKPAWQVGWLPSGFELTEYEMRRVGDVRVSTRVYSDGLSAFSVFLEKVAPDTQAEGSRTHGATAALSRRLAEPANDYLITVVGEIPMETAMQIAMAVTLDN